jgi:hypothetical protein
MVSLFSSGPEGKGERKVKELGITWELIDLACRPQNEVEMG